MSAIKRPKVGSTRWVVTLAVGVVSISMLAASCSSAPNVTRDAAAPMQSNPLQSNDVQLAALISQPPAAGVEDGGGGLTGGVFTVYGMPGATGATDPGLSPSLLQQSVAGGVRIAFTAQAGQGPYQWQVYDMSDPDAFTKAPLWDSGSVTSSGPLPAKGTPPANDAVSTGKQNKKQAKIQRQGQKKIRYSKTFLKGAVKDTAACTVSATENYCVIPPTILRVGGAYAVVTTSNPPGGQNTDKRVFSVRDVEAVSGSTTAQVPASTIKTAYGEYGIGMQFSDGSLGVTSATASVGGFTNGLPPGWSWSGIGSSIDSITQASAGASGYQGYDRTITLHQGAVSTLLGCTTQAAGSYCRPMTGAAPGMSFSAFIPKNTLPNSPVNIIDQGSGQVSTFDGNGRLTGSVTPGSYPLTISYKKSGNASNVFDTVNYQDLKWTFHYTGDKQCDDSSLPAGFAKTPAGYVCSVELPTGDWVRIVYTQPAGADHAPRVSRVVRVSPKCHWNIGKCNLGEMEMTDFGWDSSNRPYLLRAPNIAWAVASGSLSAGYDVSTQPGQQQQEADPTLQKMVFDELGRIQASISAAPSNGAPRLESDRTYAVYGNVSSQYPGASRSVAVTTKASDGSVAPQTLTRAYDDAARGLYTNEPGGLVTQAVWHPLGMSGPLATITPTKVEANVYDIRGRQISTSTGLPKAFDLSVCSPSVAPSKITFTSCAPSSPSQVMTQEYTYDQVSGGKPGSGDVGSGLTQQWYNAPDFSQAQNNMSVANWTPGSPSGFPLQRPQGIGNQYATIIQGGVKLKAGTWKVQVSVPDPGIDGIVKVDNQTCQFSQQLASGCTVDNTVGAKNYTTNPVQLVIALTRNNANTTPTDGNVHIRFTNTQSGQDMPVTNSIFTQRYSQVTEEDSRDPIPGTKNAYSSSSYLTFGDPGFTDPTVVAGDGDSPDYPGTGSTGTLTSQYAINPLGSVQVLKQTNASGAVVFEATYYGDGQTVANADFTNVGEVSDEDSDLLDTKQRGMLKTIISPTGRRKNFIYDRYGATACTQVAMSDNDSDAHWSCKLRDDMYRIRKTTTSGYADAGTIVNNYTYQFGSSATGPAMTSTVKTQQPNLDGSIDNQTQVTELDSAGRELKYIDAVGTVTSKQYDAQNMITTEQITPAAAKDATQYKPIALSYTYNPSSVIASVAMDGQPLAKVSYLGVESGPFVGFMDSVTYPALGNVSVKMQYSLDNSTGSRTFTMADKTFTESVNSTLGGRTLSSKFDGTNMAFKYDNALRMQWAELDGTDFTYGYDQDGQRVCSAYAISNPDGTKACSALNGRFDTHYTNGMADSQSNNPKVQISQDLSQAYTATGSLQKTFDSTTNSTSQFKYDPRGMLAQEQVTNPDPTAALGTSTNRRDADGRLIALTMFSSNAAPSPTPSPPTSAVAPNPATSAVAPNPTQPAPTQPEAAASAPAPPAPGTSAPGTSVRKEAGANDPSPSPSVQTITNTESYGFASPNDDQPTVRYTDSGPVLALSLPGGVAVNGAVGVIQALSGFASLNFDATNGQIGQFYSQYQGPFGETENADPGKSDPTSVIPATNTVAHGVRSFLPALGLFLQPDPSFVPGQPTYGLANGDPVNYADPSGLSSEPKKAAAMPWWAQTLISLFASALGTFAAGMVGDAIIALKGFKDLGNGVKKFIFFVTYSFINVGISVATAAAITGGDLKKVWGTTWAMDGMMAMFSGYLGAYTATIGATMTNLVAKATALLDQIPVVLAAGKKMIADLGKDYLVSLESYADKFLETAQAYRAEIKAGIAGGATLVSESIDIATNKLTDVVIKSKNVIIKAGSEHAGSIKDAVTGTMKIMANKATGGYAFGAEVSFNKLSPENRELFNIYAATQNKNPMELYLTVTKQSQKERSELLRTLLQQKNLFSFTVD